MTGEPLDEVYFNWLYRQVAPVGLKNPRRTYWRLLHQLYTKPFAWFVPNDDNRMADGKDLRAEFLGEANISEPDEEWMALDCSVLEMLVAFSRRVAYIDLEEQPASVWFWRFLENIDLRSYVDAKPRDDGEIDAILNRLIWRNYEENGEGGLFPLSHPEEDQRKVELWYQANAYLIERG